MVNHEPKSGQSADVGTHEMRMIELEVIEDSPEKCAC